MGIARGIAVAGRPLAIPLRLPGTPGESKEHEKLARGKTRLFYSIMTSSPGWVGGVGVGGGVGVCTTHTQLVTET